MTIVCEISPGHAAGLSVVYRPGAADQDDCLRDVGILFGMEAKTMNFFNWIREGVRQAVLYGVHDAVGELGPARRPGHERADPAPAADLAGRGNSAVGRSFGCRRRAKRKRLGRTLGDIQATMEAGE